MTHSQRPGGALKSPGVATTHGGRHVDYSIVIPVYCNADCLRPLFHALTVEVLQANPELAGEVIFVDDGSEDGSLEELRRIRSDAPGNVTIIKLTRNFGQANALLAGYEHARGDCVITISADGQEPPALVNEMLRGFFDDHCEIVICTRSGRDESLYRRFTSHLYFSSMRRLTFKSMPKGGFDVWLMGGRALEAFLRHYDPNPSFQWRVLWMGFKTKYISYHRRSRLAGVSHYTFAKKINAVLDGLLGYSFVPVRGIWLSGCAFSLLGVASAGYLLVDCLGRGNPLAAWAPSVIVLLVLGGLQMTMLGIVGEYVWRTLTQVRARDLYVIDAIYTAEDT